MSFLEYLVPIFGIVFTFGIPGLIIFWAIYTKHKERMRLIEKGIPPEDVKKFYSEAEKVKDPLRGLKWGIILAFLGGGIIIANLLYEKYQINDGMTFGFVILFLGIGFLVYYFVVKSKYQALKTNNSSELKS